MEVEVRQEVSGLPFSACFCVGSVLHGKTISFLFLVSIAGIGRVGESREH